MLNVTQTGVVMFKTVKSAMRVMMVGLVALLGANAEAHYVVVSGKYKYCSLHCIVDLMKVPNPILGPAQVRCEATAALVEISCPSGTLVQSAVNGVLVGQGPIDQSNWQQGGKAHVEVLLGMPESLLDQLTGLCDDPDWTPTPGKVKILEMPRADICVGPDLPDLCSSAASTAMFYNCTIPSGSPRGTLYECDTQIIDHIE
jgi:hypothetical protein